jgi:hypothetical protein
MKDEKPKAKDVAPAVAQKEVPHPPKPKKRKKKAPYIYAVIMLVAIAFGAFYFVKYQQLDDKYTELTMTEEERAKKTVSEVSALYKIPSYDEEKPTQLVVLKDEKSLEQLKKDTSFLKDAQLNDILLAYQKADTVVLYRPSEKKIIASDQYSKILAGTVNIAIIAPADKTEAAEQTIKQKINNAIVTSKSNPQTTITSGLVVDVTGKESEAAKKTAELLGYTVGSLPQGETMPTGATFVVLVPNAPSQ